MCGQTPLLSADENGHERVAALLQSYKAVPPPYSLSYFLSQLGEDL